MAAIRAELKWTVDPAEGMKKPGVIITLTADSDDRAAEIEALGYRRNPYGHAEWAKYLALNPDGNDANAIIKPELETLRKLGVMQISQK
jgi:hypothetical protein